MWSPFEGMVITHFDQHLFIFPFFSRMDGDFALEKGP